MGQPRPLFHIFSSFRIKPGEAGLRRVNATAVQLDQYWFHDRTRLFRFIKRFRYEASVRH